jgi:uncharacterized membrane protein YeiH
VVALPTLSAFEAANAVGLAAFALVGSLTAVEAELDLLGVAVAGVATALGGGITRDALVGRTPAALTAEMDVLIALADVVLAVVVASLGRRDLSASPVVTVPDAVGLAAFAATGALVGAEAGLSAFGVVTLATLTGVGGSVIRDVLLQEVPFVLHEDFYATCAVVGGVAFWAATAAGLSASLGAGACAATTLGLRLAALRRDWALPTVDAIGKR